MGVELFRPDWLHTLDLGVAPLVLGHLIWFAVPHTGQANRAGQLQHIWNLCQEFYRRVQPPSRLDNLTIGMVKERGKGPKLRGKAGEVRYLVPFGKELADQFLTDTDPFTEAMRTLATQLHLLYQNLSQCEPEAMAKCSRRVAALLVALEAAAPQGFWKFKPKVHLMQEMCERLVLKGVHPRDSWTYRDEDFGGELAASAHSRGGPNDPANLGIALLQRFRAMHSRVL